ncbi:hypothetical protein CD178_03228 (plasmid) [Komagataeibacter saccharivorans]|uniref:Uncharacterized protein n=1 Tax=Komagataeibacter saccharivorans TaxID=265959 RepID=A0A347WGH9_9PROT|nr:hypothetical protein CD178_03228 [Komagataeibacter saccharivorans]
MTETGMVLITGGSGYFLSTRSGVSFLNPLTVSRIRASAAGSDEPWPSRRGVYGVSNRFTSSSVRPIESAAMVSSICF